MDTRTRHNGIAVPAVRRPKRIRPQKPLDTIDVACLIINKMIGAGIFVSSPMVTYIVGNKLGALVLWIIGGIVSFIRCVSAYMVKEKICSGSFVLIIVSITVYLEYGLAWPYNGGEFYYVRSPVPFSIRC
jgi:hypothetical protein